MIYTNIRVHLSYESGSEFIEMHFDVSQLFKITTSEKLEDLSCSSQ